MATVSKDIAEELLERVKGQKRPKIYCIVSYVDLFTGGTNYAYYENQRQFGALLESPVVGEYEILWSSARFEKDNPRL